jgi:hypothetical protein
MAARGTEPMSGGRRLIYAQRLRAITGRLHPKTAVRGKRPPNRSPSPALITRTLIALVPVQTESVRQLAVELHAWLPLLPPSDSAAPRARTARRAAPIVPIAKGRWASSPSEASGGVPGSGNECATLGGAAPWRPCWKQVRPGSSRAASGRKGPDPSRCSSRPRSRSSSSVPRTDREALGRH